MTYDNLKVLSLEDDLQDFEIVSYQLNSAGFQLEIVHVDNEGDFEQAIRNSRFDIILADFNLPGYNAFNALKLCKEVCPETPFICVSGSIGEELAIDLLKLGADDYVLKDRPDRLPYAIRRALSDAREKETRRKTEIALQQSEENFRHSISDSPLGIRIVTVEGNTIYANQAFLDIFECESLNEFINTPSNERYTLESYAEHQIRKQNRKSGVETLDYEVCITSKKGGIKYILVSRKEIFWNGEKHFQVINQDITQRKLAEEAIIQVKKDWEDTFNSITDAISIHDTNFNMILANEASKVLLKLPTVEKYMDLKCFNLFHGKNSPMEGCPACNCLKTREPGIVEIFEPKLARYVEIRGIPRFDKDNQPIGMIHIVRDITERKHNEEELRAAKEKAEESVRLKSAFLANMSHEIRTPMNGILGFAELLRQPNLSTDQQDEYLRIIEKSGVRMLNIINDIVDISKIESGQMKIVVSETNVNEQLDFIFAFFKSEVEQKGLSLSKKSTLSTSKAYISTDREKLYAILTNLVKNAIKFTVNGSIEFGYHLVKSSNGNSGEDQNHPYLHFFVKDTGIGIPVERQGAIFERFIQADPADKMARQGAGLGLAISKAYVEMLGGKIWVESKEGKGALFCFTLPYNPPVNVSDHVADDAAPTSEELPTHRLKIVIAEDDIPSGQLISIALKKYSKETIIVRNGLEAVEVCRKNSDVDLVLMDIQMPKMDGYEATRIIREFNSNVVVIAQTAYALGGDKEKAMEAGCTDYIAKPIRRDQLDKMINMYFNLQ